MLNLLKQNQKSVAAARNHKDVGFKWTRRIIALASVGTIVVAPILASIFIPSLPISYGFAESVGGFMFFTDPREALVWTTGTGILIGPIHTYLVYAIAGMYFGSSTVE